ncbi:hypothetical protein CONPUDRAFT_159086 [Coniophora puteana RWD-64-598 SS2]|uniref:Uncharacterized protein n=1 Tax=Coniophora puteana (strain RWD-64-598) TaxID=741705 RepID=A0A5M3M969_CONPW|nr:uncharacterized protein CONPUDRAFT_159086 [Coniophora puteana RWD-64-598 SS2]EIW75643.1 hypothetical protein CONPUDRAFT_159086 [Coniophora puteana RWD-64-598 SS2]
MPPAAGHHTHGPTMEGGKTFCLVCLAQGQRTLLKPKKAKKGLHKGQWYVNCFHRCHPPKPGKPGKRASSWYFWPEGVKPLGVVGDGPVESVPSTPSSSPLQNPTLSTSFSSSSSLHLDDLPPSISAQAPEPPLHHDWVLPTHSYPIQPIIQHPSFPPPSSSSANNPILLVPQSQPPPALPLPLPSTQPLPQSQPAPGAFKCAFSSECGRVTSSKGCCQRPLSPLRRGFASSSRYLSVGHGHDSTPSTSSAASIPHHWLCDYM